MITYRVDIVVDRPAADVFPYFADVTRHPSWMGGSSATPTTEGPMRTGYRYTHRSDEGEMEMEVTALDAGHSFSARTLSGPFTWEGTFAVEDEGPTRSRVTSSGRVQMKGVMRIVQPFLGGEIRRREQAELTRLKALVERAA
jgi:uncharacterized protein YndB with AHSA1/START domain